MARGPMPDYIPYPQPDTFATLPKVNCFYYYDKAQADKASAAAKLNLRMEISSGRYYNYSPYVIGSCFQVSPNEKSERAGMYCVTVI